MGTRHATVNREVYEATRANLDALIAPLQDGESETDRAIAQMFVLGALCVRAANPSYYAMLEAGFAPYVDEMVNGTEE